MFHNVGAQKENAGSPYVTEFMAGIINSDLEDERRLRGGIVVSWTTNRPERVHEES